MPGLPAQPPVRVEEVQCVEVAQSAACATVPVRDSKNPTGPVVTIGADAWTAFVNSLRQPPVVEVHCTWSRGLEIGHR
ncbi:DUF397 domain-containing protein [Streptomyces pristinaespiralis]|uniref:DUF397 domain-containing protein n=1 Tax=Streptomyces pristinaespiralis TaxID=38300 RepID=UPI003F4D0881